MDEAAPELRLAGGSLELLDAVCRFRRGEEVVETAGGGWTQDGEALVCEAGAVRLRLRVRRRRRWHELYLTARSTAGVQVEALGLRFRPLSEPPARWLLYDGYQSWDPAGVADLEQARSARRSWWRCGLGDDTGAGVAMVAASAKRHATRFDVAAGEIAWLQVAPPLGEGNQPVWSSAETAEFESEPLRIAAGRDVRAELASCLARLARTWGPPPRGWLSWYHNGIWVDAEAVLANSELLAAGVAGDLAPAVVQIDDGWQQAYGDWVPNTKFPDLAGLCRELAGRNQTPGIWTAPFLVSAGSGLAGTAPDSWFLLNPATGGRLVDPVHTVFGPMYVLDPRVLPVRRHLTQVFATLRAQGVRYFKIDFLYAGAYAGIEGLRRGLAAIRRGAGSDAYVLACGAPLLPVAGLADGCRIGPDTCTPWLDFASGEPQPTFFGDEVLNVIRNVAARSDLGPWFHTDPDVAVAGGTLTAARARQLITAVALCGGLYFLSDDLRALAPERLALIANPAFAAIAAGGRAAPAWEPDGRDLPASTWRRGQELLAVFNHGHTPLARTVEVPAGAAARDVWTAEALRSTDGLLTLEVEPEGVRLIRFEGG